MFKSLALTTLMLFSTMSLATPSQSEFFYQAPAGMSFFELTGNYAQVQHELRGMSEKFKLTDLNLNMNFEHGFSELMSLYLKVGYGHGKADMGPFANAKAKGLNPIDLGLKAKLDLETGMLLFARANVSIAALEEYDCSASSSCNRMDKSTALTLRLGMTQSFGEYLLGLALDYGVFSTDFKMKGVGEEELTGGFSVTALYERFWDEQALLGASISYSRQEAAGLPLNNLFYISDTDEEMNLITAKLYTRYLLAGGLTLLASAHYDLSLDQSDDTYDGGNGWGVELGIRTHF